MTVVNDEIELLSAVEVQDKDGLKWTVRVSMDKTSYCADVAIELLSVTSEKGKFVLGDDNCPEDYHGGLMLCEDKAFLENIRSHLASIGYTGPGFWRAEFGMQSQTQVVLESNRAFEQFAHEKFGWTYEGGMQEWRLNEVRRRFERAFPWHNKLELNYPDGSVWTAPLFRVLNLYEKSLRDAHKGDFESYCAFLENPEVKGNGEALRAWVVANATELSKELLDDIRMVKRPTVDPMMTSLLSGNFDFK